MGKKLEYVAGVIDQIEALQAHIASTPQVLAEEFLRSTLMDTPRPPWNTGELRRSGAVYIGTMKYMTTSEVAAKYGFSEMSQNPRHLEMNWYNIGKATHVVTGGRREPFTPKRLRTSKLTYKGTGSTGSLSSLRGKVVVIYNAPHAAMMHEWQGRFTDYSSGSHFVSQKIPRVLTVVALRMQINDKITTNAMRKNPSSMDRMRHEYRRPFRDD